MRLHVGGPSGWAVTFLLLRQHIVIRSSTIENVKISFDNLTHNFSEIITYKNFSQLKAFKGHHIT